MGHDRNKILFFLLTLICFTGCSNRSPEELLIKDIEDNYANLYVNNEPQKRAVIKELRNYFKEHKLNDENIAEIKKILHRLGDGHVVLFDERKEKKIRYRSGVDFFPGSNYIKSCESCRPLVPNDKWEVLEVNSSSLAEYFEINKYLVAASSDWGREYRLMRLLQENITKTKTNLKLKSSKGKIYFTDLIWKEVVPATPDCVRGARIDEFNFKLIVSNLWCLDESKGEQDRLLIYENFRNQFDQALNEATSKDNIILDLRENGGGGDYEVEYVLNAFFSRSVFMYHYKYLRKTRPGKRKHFEKFWPFMLDVWSKDEYQYTDLGHKPKKTFYENKLVTLISPGCFSSCETIASTLKLEKRSKIVGTKTHGGAGDPVIFAIAGTPYSINLPTCITWQESNEFFEGVGVLPDEIIYQNKKSIKDDVLNKAIGPAR